MQKGVFVCFMEYAKAPNKVRHKDLFELLGKFYSEKPITIIRNIYEEQSAYTWIEKEFSTQK